MCTSVERQFNLQKDREEIGADRGCQGEEDDKYGRKAKEEALSEGSSCNLPVASSEPTR